MIEAKLAGLLAGAFSIAGYVPYWIAIRRRQTIPNQTTWFIYTVLDVLLAFFYTANGATDTKWATFGFLAGSAITFVVSLKYGVDEWTTLDQWCLVVSASSLMFWAISVKLALYACIAAMVMGTIPTIMKTYREPWTEDRLAWTCFFTGSILNLFAINSWTFVIAGLPVCGLILGGFIMTFLYRPVPRPA